MHTSSEWVFTQQFLAIKSRKMARKVVFLAYIVEVCRGNCTKPFDVICPGTARKIRFQFWGSSPISLEPKKPFCDILQKYLRIVTRFVNRKLCRKLQCLTRILTRSGILWYTNGEKYDPQFLLR